MAAKKRSAPYITELIQTAMEAHRKMLATSDADVVRVVYRPATSAPVIEVGSDPVIALTGTRGEVRTVGKSRELVLSGTKDDVDSAVRMLNQMEAAATEAWEKQAQRSDVKVMPSAKRTTHRRTVQKKVLVDARIKLAEMSAERQLKLSQQDRLVVAYKRARAADVAGEGDG